jgi:hypothetical protein
MYRVREGFYAEDCGISGIGVGSICEATQKGLYCSKKDVRGNKTFLKCTNIGTSKSPEYKWQTTTDSIGTAGYMETGIKNKGDKPTCVSKNSEDNSCRDSQ